jgi:hypothetical protein
MLKLVAGIVVLAGAVHGAGLEGYSIVKPEPASPVDEFVLEDVCDLLSRGLGGERLKVCAPAAAPASKRIFFGIPSPGFDVASLADQEHVVAVKGGDVYLFGGGTNGTRYAAYAFLRNVLGYRFFDARGGVRVPDLRKAELSDSLRRRKFSFEDRYMSCWGYLNKEKSAMYLYRNGINGAADGSLQGFIKRECGDDRAIGDFVAMWPASHALVVYLPRNSKAHSTEVTKKILKGDLEKTNPEYFSLMGGKRVFGHQRCLSNPGVRELLKKSLSMRMESMKTPMYFDLSAGDTPGRFCECDGCAALEKKYGTTAGPLLDAILEFCPEAMERWPRHAIKMLVYRKKQTQRPPVNLTRLPDNFIAQFAPIDDDFSQDWTHPNNAETLADLKKWCAMSRRTLMWYYPNPYGGITPPFGNVERLANDLRIMGDAGVTGLTIEHNVGVTQMTGFTELQSYIIARLWDDVSQDWRALVREFAEFEYGPAANGVLAYLDELETLRKRVGKPFPWDASRSIFYYDYLTPENLVRWEKDFDAMERMLSGDRTRLRSLRRIRYNLDNALLSRFREVRKVFGVNAPSADGTARRIEAIAAEIAEECYAKKYSYDANAFLKSVKDSVFMKKVMSGSSTGDLPESIFGGISPDKIFLTIPVSYDGGRKPDPKAAYGLAACFEGVKKPEVMKMPFVMGFETALPRVTHRAKIGRGVDFGNIGARGEYRFYEMGELTVTSDCYVRFGDSYWFQANISGAYVEGSFNKAKVYASLKFQGPAFYPEDKGSKNEVWCDRLVVVQE